MTDDQKAALEKIKKLLRMKRGGTPGEIENALRMAAELAEKHGIDLNGVDPDAETHERPISHEQQILGARIQWECKYAMLICEGFFNVSAFLNVGNQQRWGHYRIPNKITFVGTEWDRQIAVYVYKFLVRHFRREWRDRRGRCRNRQAFLYGMYVGISAKLRERQKQTPHMQTPGIIQVERQLARRNDYIEKHFGKLTGDSIAPDGDAEEAKRRGYYAGLDTEIRPGLNSDRNAKGQHLLGSQLPLVPSSLS